MKIQCVLLRDGGTKTDLDGLLYHFEPLADGAHVAEIEIEAHIDRFLAIAEGYKIYHGKLSPKGKPQKLDSVEVKRAATEAAENRTRLNGSEVHMQAYEIHGVPYDINSIVQRAFKASGMTADEWNDLDRDDRHARIDMTLDDLEEQAPVEEEADTDDRASLVVAYEARFGKKPHGKWTAEKIKSELEA